MSKWIVDIHGDIEGDYEIIKKYEEPKTGHWIYIGNSNVNGLKICKCDVCGKRAYGSHAFCHNCGARMVEPKEGEKC